jgi:glycerophosphoryl diester phosphodiesterase
VPVVCHDPDLARLAGDARPIAETSWRELRALRFSPPVDAPTAHRVPTLAEALADARPLARINLELKPDARPAGALVLRVVEEVERAGLAPAVVYTSFDPDLVEAIGRARPAAARGQVLEVRPDGDRWAAEGWVALELALARDGLAAEARERGIEVLVWTENDAAALASWRAAGVAGVVTDLPARMVAARARLDADQAAGVGERRR